MIINSIKAYSYIRFSTPEQEKGDSLRRQIKLAEEYCSKHNLILDESLKFTDRGISAFKGQHRIKGALGRFLQLVSVLIVENLDRLSRENVDEAYDQFRNIIKSGVKVVTLQDGMEYDENSIRNNWTQLIISITYMARAHEESLVKSKRLSESWVNKREKAIKGEEILTAKTPYWIKVSDDKKQFIKITEVCKAVELIFQKKYEGKGSFKIERELNLDNTLWKPKKSKQSKSGGWRVSYINKILRNRAVIGEFQPHKYITIEDENGLKKRKRVPAGEPIQNYYPRIIDDELFFSVQQNLNENAQKNGRGGGRKDKGTNLFSHVVKCGFCGSTMQFSNKGKNNFKYLRCDSVRRKNTVSIEQEFTIEQVNKGIADHLNKRYREIPERIYKHEICLAKSVRYSEFEKIFFENFEELDISKLIPDQDEVNELIKEKEKQYTANKYKISELEKQINNLLNMIAETSDKRNRKLFDEKITEKRNDEEQLIAESKVIEKEIKEILEQKDNLIKKKDALKEIYSYLGSAKDEDERINRRLQLRQEIQNMVEWIKIYPLQEEYKEYEEIEPGIIKHMESKYIDKVRIMFKGSNELRILLLKGYGELKV